MILFSLLLLTAITSTHAKLQPSLESVHLQPEETRSITILSNISHPCNVFLRTKLPYIASVSPAQQEVNTVNPSWEVLITANQLGYTQVIAAINISNVFSFEERFIQIMVLQSHWVRILSIACGWIYFSAWTFSFYPQILSNMRRKSVVGLNFDFLALNALGHFCYSVFNCSLCFVAFIQEEYFRRHSGATNPVLLNDVLFSVHAFLATVVMIIQVFMYERGGQSLSHTAGVLLTFGICILIGILVAASQSYVMWLDAIVWISFIKLMVTVTKYIPQALMNYRNKSTEGWSIECILCDLTGSCFSLLQMILISYNCDDWVSILGDPTKFGLGVFSIGFDFVFIVQHFILYRIPDKPKKKEEERSIYNIPLNLLNKILWISDDSKK